MIEQLTKKLAVYQDGGVQVTEEEVESVKIGYNNWQKHWRMRRKACLEVVDMICEGADLKRTELFEKVGLEQDTEDIGKFA